MVEIRVLHPLLGKDTWSGERGIHSVQGVTLRLKNVAKDAYLVCFYDTWVGLCMSGILCV